MFRSIRHTCGCLVVLVILAMIAGAALVYWFFVSTNRAHAQSPPTFDIALVIDQSGSLWDCGGQGTDPNFLRVDAAHLFVNYLGADAGSSRYRLALLHFGGTTRLMAPLTDLSDPAARERLITAASNPEPIGWTNPLTALQSAHELLTTSALPDSRRVVLLMTDGEPAWPADQPVDRTAYRQQLQQMADQFAADQTDLFIVHLQATETPCGRRAVTEWLDLWQEMAGRTSHGALFTATQAGDLIPVYHAVVRSLTGASDSQTLVQAADLPVDQPLQVSVPVTELLASMTLVIVKGNGETVVVIQDPNGQLVAPSAPGISAVGVQTKQEVWRVEQPATGLWQVLLTGSGKVTVWQDRVRPLPTPTFTATALPTATPTPAATATPSPTPTDSPTLTPTDTPPPTAMPTATPTATPTESPTATQTPSATPTAIPPPTATPMPTPTESPPPPPADSARWRRWLLFSGLGLFTLVAVVSSLAWRRNGYYLTGQLVFERAPGEDALPLPLGFGGQRLKQVVVGHQGQGRWDLATWPGAFRIRLDHLRRVLLVPDTGEVMVNGIVVRTSTPLQHGDEISCGDYRLRYENLLL